LLKEQILLRHSPSTAIACSLVALTLAEEIAAYEANEKY